MKKFISDLPVRQSSDEEINSFGLLSDKDDLYASIDMKERASEENSD